MTLRVLLGVPNYVIKSLYWDYLLKHLEINFNTQEDVNLAMKKVRKDADLADFMKIYQNARASILSKEDLKWNNELVSKVIFIMLARQDGMYLIKSEKETKEGYLDIYFQAGTQYIKYTNYNYVIEFKHTTETQIKTKAKKEQRIKEELQNASVQLENYMKDENIHQESELPVKKLVVITIGKNDVVYQIL